MCFLWLNGKNDFFFLDTEMQKKQAHAPYLGKVKKKRPVSKWLVTSEIFYGMFVSIWDASWTAPRFVSSIYHEGVGLFTGCLPFFHSGPVGNGDWIPVNQHRWIGPRPRWLSGAAVYARVYSFVCGGAWHCVPTLYACCSLWTTAHLCHSISSLIWILSSLNHCQYCCAPSLASWMQRRMVFLWTSILDFAIKLLSRHSWILFSWKWAFSICSERWGGICNVWERTHFVSHSW